MFDESFVESLEKNLSARALRALEFTGDTVRAAVMVILRPGAGETEMCFIKRADCPLDRFSGQMAFPGGVKEENDSDALATAFRETLEETGLDIKRCGRIVGRLDDETPRSVAEQSGRSYLVTPFVSVLTSQAQTRVCDEVERIFWMPASGLERRDAGDSAEFFCQGQRIWGMTARIVEKLLGVMS